MKYIKAIFILTLPLLMILGGCQSMSQETPTNKTTHLLGTVITATVYGDQAEHALNLAFERVQEIEDKMSRYQGGSQVDLVNQNPKGDPVEISSDTYLVMERALDFADKTDGAFNPLIGEIVDLWGIGTPDAKVPSPQELNEFLPYIDHKQLKLSKESDPTKLTATLTSSQVKVDLGAIAKGYAADQMRDILLEEGITSALLNLGGNVIVLGSKPDGSPWSIGVQDPLAPERGDIAAVIKAKDISVVTSGSYERYFEEDGIRYHHIMDPFTGAPAENGVISSTIIAPSSMDADALSTALYVLGKDKGLRLIESLPHAEAIIITDDLHVYTSSGITDQLFDLRSEDFIYEKSR